MKEDCNSFCLNIADLNFYFISKSERIDLNSDLTVGEFVSDQNDFSDYIIEFYDSYEKSLNKGCLVFKGDPVGNEYLNYSWNVYDISGFILIEVLFEDHNEIKSLYAELTSSSNKVKVFVNVKRTTSSVVIDPLIHPLGSLLLLYIMHWNNGLLIHGSAVKINEESVGLFTGVSGVGKSTMAKLWKNSGACILNDDRLIIRYVDGIVNIYNNPMPYYSQKPQQGELQKIFLIRHSLENYTKKISGVNAYSRVLGNFIQQFYNKEMVMEHLLLIEKVLSRVEVYELGFKPDLSIVSMLKELYDNDKEI